MSDDRWLDAFDEAELDHAELARLDERTRRVLEAAARDPQAPVARTGSIPRRHWMRSLALVAILVIVAGTAMLLTRDVPEASVLPGVSPSEALDARVDRIPHAQPEVPIPTVHVAPDATPRATRPTAAPAPSPPHAEGLRLHDGAQVRRDGDALVLARGAVAFRRDDTHDPGVRRIAFDTIPVTLDPEGTVFTAAATGAVAYVRVDDGVVAIRHVDGRALSRVPAGRSALAWPEDGDVTVFPLDDAGLDAIWAAVAPSGAAPPRDVIALVSRHALTGGTP